MNAAASHSVRCFPGELQHLLQRDGLVAAPTSPLANTAALLAAPAVRPAEAARLEAVGLVGSTRLTTHLQAIAAPAATIEIRRGIHRRSPFTWYVCAGVGPSQVYSVISVDADGSSRLLLPGSLDELADWVVHGMRRIPAPGISLHRLPPLTGGGLSVVLAMADYFRFLYPYPDRDWTPTQALRFSAERIREVLDDGAAGRDVESLAAGWRTLAGLPGGVPSLDDVRGVLLMLGNEQYLDADHDDSGDIEFVMGRGLTWMARCLAWWDLSLALRPWSVTPADPDNVLTAIQASTIWRISNAKGPVGPVYGLYGQSGENLVADVRQWLARAFAVPDVRPAVRVPVAAPAAVRAVAAPDLTPRPQMPAALPVVPVCPACGRQAKPGAKFCGKCGTRFAT